MWKSPGVSLKLPNSSGHLFLRPRVVVVVFTSPTAITLSLAPTKLRTLWLVSWLGLPITELWFNVLFVSAFMPSVPVRISWARSAVCDLISVDLSCRSLTISQGVSCCRAACKGDGIFPGNVPEGFASYRSKVLTTSICPWKTAKCKGVTPHPSLLFTSAPHASRHSTNVPRFLSTATCNTVERQSSLKPYHIPLFDLMKSIASFKGMPSIPVTNSLMISAILCDFCFITVLKLLAVKWSGVIITGSVSLYCTSWSAKAFLIDSKCSKWMSSSL